MDRFQATRDESALRAGKFDPIEDLLQGVAAEAEFAHIPERRAHLAGNVMISLGLASASLADCEAIDRPGPARPRVASR
jgi:hypothetical protein